jgi:hypothetical protein
MATYSELRALFSDGDLRNKVEVACIVAAEAINVEGTGATNHTNRLLWAKSTWSNPRGASLRMLMALLAANKDAAVANITGATDVQIQAKVDAAIDVFADGS